MLAENDVVTVVEDDPQQGVDRGDVGAVVHCYPRKDAYEVEILDEAGRSRGTKMLLGKQLLKLNLRSLVA
ncbi:MAG: DUF4926 domain-containing protein [Phycisphaerae bacterium]|nr:DUF4926 domain-containing protein [Phycisphaerae bacterium]